MKTIIIKSLIFFLLIFNYSLVHPQKTIQWQEYVNEFEQKHPDKSGIYILEKGEDALIARAWLVDHATHSIDVQYFIWSTDNIGTLAASALLRAANRGVHVRVIIDDLLVDADNEVLYALAVHPNIEIKIYNPNINIGTSFLGKLFNATVNFRDINQRMHNKVIIVDKQAIITGGRNMADEYYDYDHEYNFKDRDILALGQAARSANTSFNEFWHSEYAVSIERLIDNPYKAEIDTITVDIWGDEQYIDEAVIEQQLKKSSRKKIADVYQYLSAYELDKNNFEKKMRKKIHDINQQFTAIIEQISWVNAVYISDAPGKNSNTFTLSGGGKLTSELKRIINSARQSITIQSPYLVMSWDAWKLLRDTVKRGVKVRIVTNSLSSTDNLAAYSGYARQRNRLLNTGFEIYEFKPDAKIRVDVINRYDEIKNNPPIFALHAKSMVVDGIYAYIGSFNFDPRSQNLNTEAGVIIKDKTLAKILEATIEIDMHPDNSWNVKQDDHSPDASFYKRSKLFLLKLIPMDAIL